MFNVMTVATKNYLPHAKRLFASLQNSGNDFQLTIFCDDRAAFSSLASHPRCTVRELAEITSVGVKRARFAAYNTALQEGSFLYLDSDVIVLKPISELVQHGRITGCHDDLSQVSIVPDKRHPWAGDPGLENRWFINSGIFFAPRGRREFFAEILERSRNDQLWERYGVLYDNSFLCAHFNLLNEAIDYVDSTVYNWQGFVVGGQLQVQRRGSSLVNYKTGQVLKIAHFAGVPDPDAAMCRWPLEVTSLLAAMGSFNEISRDRAFVDFVGALNPDFEDFPRDETPRRLLNALARETMSLTKARSDYEDGDRNAYLADPEEMLSFAYAQPISGSRWNGSPCGGAYFDGEEYNLLLRFVRELEIGSAVQIGSRHTGKLLSEAGVQTLCLGYRNQPLPLQVQELGYRFAHLSVDEKTGLFESGALHEEIAAMRAGQIDLLLVDLPDGAVNDLTLQQLIEVSRPKYVIIHDARLHSAGIFLSQQRFGARILAYYDSPRGLAMLAMPSGTGSELSARFSLQLDPAVRVENPRVRLELADSHAARVGTNLQRISVTVTNLGQEALSSRYHCPVLLSYHWMTDNHEIRVVDGLRTAMPFDILPGCSATFRVTIALEPGCSLCCVTMVQENVCWFDDRNQANRLLLRINGEAVTPVAQAEGSNSEVVDSGDAPPRIAATA
jgi:hypothetical protein